MKSIYFMLRRIAWGIVAFFLLTVALFIFWRSFSDTFLLYSVLPPHIPPGAGTEFYSQARAYLGLNLPIYQQYFRFIVHIFTGNWAGVIINYGNFGIQGASVYDLVSFTIRNTLFTMFLSVLFGYLIFRIFGRSNKTRPKRIGKAPTGLFYISVAIGLPLAAFYTAKTINSIFHGAYIPLSGAGFTPPPLAFTGIPHFQKVPDWITTYYVLPFITNPTHVLVLDAIINFDPKLFSSFLAHIALSLITISLTLSFTLLIIRSNALSSSKFENEAVPAGEQELRKYIICKVRKGIFSNSAVLSTILLFSAMYSEILFGYTVGFGSSFWYLHVSAIGLGTYVYYGVITTYNIWGYVYMSLTIGIILIVLSTAGSIINGFLSRNKNTEKRESSAETKKKLV